MRRALYKETRLKRHEQKQRWERLTALLEPIHKQALGTARRLGQSKETGDGIYQDAVLRAFDKLHTLRDESRFKSWFFAVLITVHRSRLRRSFWKRYTSLTVAGDGLALKTNREITPDDEVFRTRRIFNALSLLSAKQREAVVLFEVEGFSIEEIAKVQKSSIPAVKSRLVRGRARLKDHYVKMGWIGSTGSVKPMAEEGLPEGGKL